MTRKQRLIKKRKREKRKRRGKQREEDWQVVWRRRRGREQREERERVLLWQRDSNSAPRAQKLKNKMLCQTCLDIFHGQRIVLDQVPFERYPLPSFRNHHETFQDLLDAAQAKCYICEYVWLELLKNQKYWDKGGALDHDSQDARVRALVARLHTKSFGQRPFSEYMMREWMWYEIPRVSLTIRILPLELLIREEYGLSKYLRLLYTFEVKLWDEDHEASITPFGGKDASCAADVTSDERQSTSLDLDLAKHWLEECIRNHSECSSFRTITAPPRRLLEIDAPSKGYIRLIETHGRLAYSYITLSHCWGGKEMAMTLKKDSRAILAQGIEVSGLTATFHDAVKVAEALDVAYLWIDSLCIFQGSSSESVSDWRDEFQNMGQIYKGGICNIAATASEDSSGGLFNRQLSRKTAPCIMEYSWDKTPKILLQIHVPAYTGDYRLLSGPLLQRGWVVQELVLAPRILHFGERQVFWTCAELSACETYPRFVPQAIMDTVPGHRLFGSELSRLQRSQWLQRSQDTISQTLAYWRDVVEQYTKCNLTFEKDKLVTISGLAKEVGKVIEGRYLAGMWETQLEKKSLLESLALESPQKHSP